MKASLLSASILVLLAVRPSPASAQAVPEIPGCSVGTYEPHYGGYNPVHQAMVLTDPLGEQTAKFDLAFGGTLVSLTYQGAELVYGDVTGAQVQPTLFGGQNPEATKEGNYYNPESGGDNALYPPDTDIRGGATHGAYCSSSTTITMISAATDYNLGRSGHRPLYTVYSTGPQRGSPNPFAAGCPYARDDCAQFTTPHSITTIATFVPNLAGASPSYYLRLTQIIANASLVENIGWSHALATYGPTSWTANQIGHPAGCVRVTFEQCVAASTPDLLAGSYPNANHTSGIATYVAPQTFWNFFPGVSTCYISLYESSATNLWVNSGPGKIYPLYLGQANRYAWYVMAGNWSAAVDFALQN